MRFTSARAETLEDVAFLSGAALSHLHLVVNRAEVPQRLLRERLALRAAEACVARSGRPERAGELRDAVAFLQPGDQPGPGGVIFQQWRRAVARPISVAALQRALPETLAENTAIWRHPWLGGPVDRAAQMLATVLDAAPREEVAATILADAALAQACGWNHVVPLLAAGLDARDLRKRGVDLRLACHTAVLSSSDEALRMASYLTRRASRLRAVAPKLRAKGAGAAVEMFLTCDAVAPAALTSLIGGVGMSDRAARRFCGRLAELGAVRELTGRDTFRLYGL